MISFIRGFRRRATNENKKRYGEKERSEKEVLIGSRRDDAGRKRKIEKERRGGEGRGRKDRQKRLSQRQNESETNKIGWTRRESRRCRGTLVVLASMGKGQQIH